MDTIFFIPGMWSGKDNFTNYSKYFTSKGFKCVFPILKYHDIDSGNKPDPILGTTGITEYVDQLEEEYCKIKGPIIILGHSMGGLLAQLLSVRVKPKSLILLSSAPPFGINPLTYSVIKSYIGIFLIPFFWKKAYKIPLKSAKYAFLNNLPPEKQLSEYNKLVHESGRAILEIGLPIFDKKKSSSVNSRDIDCPVLVLHGLLDNIVPYNTGVKIAEKYGNLSTLKLLDKNAHLIEIEDGWKDTADYIYSWILDN